MLRPGGTFVVYDILQGPGGPVRYPTPWSADGTTSFLVDPAGLRRHLADAGFEVRRSATAALRASPGSRRAPRLPPPRAARRRSACASCSAPLFQDAFANLIANLEAATVVPTFVRAVRR